MSRCVVNVSFGNSHYLRKQKRLVGELMKLKENRMTWWDMLPKGSPAHREIPYAFKAVALAEAARHYSLLMWADSSIVPLQRLEPIWEYAKEHGVWLSEGGWLNSEWTADSAYPDLFPNSFVPSTIGLEGARAINRKISHVAATAFAFDLEHRTGKEFFTEYYRLAIETQAFKGPWINSPKESPLDIEHDICGPPDVKGHRHDQTAASVLAWRLGIPLTRPPQYFGYGTLSDMANISLDTILLADGAI